MRTAKLVCMAVAVMAGAAMGQQDKPLSGPTLKQDRPAGLGGQFAEGMPGDRKGPMTERIPMRLYAEAVDKLRGEQAPEGLRLSPDQEQQIRQIEANFRNTMQEYGRRAREEAASRRAAAKGQNEPAAPDNQQQARLRELRRNAPNPTDSQVKIYALLTPAQQQFVDAEVAKSQAELEKRRTEEYMQRQLQKRKADPGAAPQPVPPPGAPEGRERFRRIVERLQQLPPEERERILRRLEEELDRRVGPRGPDGAAPKPPPKLEEVKVPPPEKP